MPIVLASGSSIRHQLLVQAAVPHEVRTARVDEASVKTPLISEQASPRDVANVLAEMKARKVSEKDPTSLVIGCDQTLDFDGELLSKPMSKTDALDQLMKMCGARHSLHSAAVICLGGTPIWRHVGQVRLSMRDASKEYLEAYIDRNWDNIQHCVGAYQLEGEGVRLFTRVEGDYFHVLGLPLLELLAYLTLRGELET